MLIFYFIFTVKCIFFYWDLTVMMYLFTSSLCFKCFLLCMSILVIFLKNVLLCCDCPQLIICVIYEFVFYDIITCDESMFICRSVRFLVIRPAGFRSDHHRVCCYKCFQKSNFSVIAKVL